MGSSIDPVEGYNVLITGGAGFLGGEMVRQILAPDSPVKVRKLTVLDLLAPQNPEDDRLEVALGDVRDFELLSQLAMGKDLVIHSAAIVDWGTRTEQEILDVNYGGTRNMVKACRGNGVQAMLYTSSLDVLFDGRDLTGVDEDTPYPGKHSTSYCTSKYLSEKYVREANGNGLHTCVLRPSDIYGEGDPFHIGSLVSMAKTGFYIRLGDGKAHCQHVYVGNMAHAHLLAGKALLEGNEKIRGKAYFITDAPSSNFFHFFDRIVSESGYRIWPRNLWLPRSIAGVIGSISEFIALLARPFRKYTPKMSRFAVTYTCTNYTFTAERAREDFGFEPKFTPEEAFKRTVEYYRQQKEDGF